MIVSISQPAYLPWLGYFNRVAKSDLAIVLDNVMLERSSKTRFTNRNKIKTAQGAKWLTVPVRTAGLGQPLICDVEIDIHQDWSRKHLQSIKQSYSMAPFFDSHIEWLEEFYAYPWKNLAPMLHESTSYMLKNLAINTPLIYSSKLPINGCKSELILNLCKHVNADKYISGPFGRDYLDGNAFESAGIELEFDDYVHPIYPQINGAFQSNLSSMDLLFNCGDQSKEILISNRM